MKKALPLGNGTLLPFTETRKQKIAQSSRASKPLVRRVSHGGTHGGRSASRPIPPPPAIPAAVAEAQSEPLPTFADVTFRDRAWPRTFVLPCLERYRDYKAEPLVAQLALAFHGIEPEMHELVATLAQTRPTEAAALAEAVAILEQCACMEGLATALDTIPCNGDSPALRLAALAKVQALNRRHK